MPYSHNLKKEQMLTWIEISKSAFISNVQTFRKLIGKDLLLAPVVKANAYGHGTVVSGLILEEAGVDYLCINSLSEAKALRQAGISLPLYVLGYIAQARLNEVLEWNIEPVVYNTETLYILGKLSNEKKQKVYIHIKIETGTNRQGINIDDIDEFLDVIETYPFLEVRAIATHLASVEDGTNRAYMDMQLALFDAAYEKMKKRGIECLRHCANAASTMLFPETHFDMVRPGVSIYGIWPSVKVRAAVHHLEKGKDIRLKEVLSWKSRIAQIKKIPEGSAVGYGCSEIVKRDTVLGIVPTGYYDGYDRNLGGKAHVLVNGVKAPLVGRVCMNVIMVDITDVSDVKIENEVVLMGASGSERITSEDMARWMDRIEYEVPTRIGVGVDGSIPRIIVE
ncbi:MAG: alanine racemase [Flavobacteriaceae bacterium]|jgi:alanine racemase